jgi:hypothetical protein
VGGGPLLRFYSAGRPPAQKVYDEDL